MTEIPISLDVLMGAGVAAEKMRPELEKLREQLASARADLVASAQTAARFEGERDALDDENLRLREQAGDMDAELDAARARLAELEAALRNLADSLPASAAYVTSSTLSALREARRALEGAPAAETGSGEA